jgi:hypothetical protein
MAFLQFQTYTGEYLQVTHPEDRAAYHYVPSGDYEGDGTDIEERRTGCLWRMSAPGYLDCTDWSPAADEAEARRECAESDVCPDCGESFAEYEFDDSAGNWAKLYPKHCEHCPECETLLPGYDALEDGIRGILGDDEARADEARTVWAILLGRAPVDDDGEPDTDANPLRLRAAGRILGIGELQFCESRSKGTVQYLNRGDSELPTVIRVSTGYFVAPLSEIA